MSATVELLRRQSPLPPRERAHSSGARSGSRGQETHGISPSSPGIVRAPLPAGCARRCAVARRVVHIRRLPGFQRRSGNTFSVSMRCGMTQTPARQAAHGDGRPEVRCGESVGATAFLGTIRARRLSTDPLSIRKLSAARQGCSSSFKLRVLGRLGWNSYGTEGTQPPANVRLSGRAKMA
jgi:hypothetical protein